MKKRIFIAITMPEEAQEYLTSLQEELEETTLYQGKKTPTEQIHLTLKFLGETEEEELEEIERKLEEVTFRPITINFNKLNVFNKKFLRIIWLSVQGTENLQKSIDLELLEHYNLEKEYVPHLTLIRIKKVNDKKKLLAHLEEKKVTTKTFTIKEFYLIESKMTGRGTEYETIRTYKAT